MNLNIHQLKFSDITPFCQIPLINTKQALKVKGVFGRTCFFNNCKKCIFFNRIITTKYIKQIYKKIKC